MEETKISTKKDDFSSIAVFLIFECMALLCFCLGGVSTIFHYIGFVLAILSFIFSAKNFDKREIGSVLLIGIPVILVGAFCGFGKLFGGFSNFAANFGVFLAIPGFFLLGLSARRLKGFNAEIVLLCMGVGAALLVLISLVATWVQYGFFYTLLYKKTPNYYYDGALFNVTTEMAWLNGLKITEISIKYAGLFGVCLCAAIPALFFISPKEQIRKFLIVAAIGLIGLLSIITIVNVMALIFLIPIVIITIVYKVFKDNKNAMSACKIILLVLAVIVCLFLVFAVMNATIPAVKNFTSGNKILNRLLNTNRFAKPFNDVLAAAIKPFNLFGFPLFDPSDVTGMNETVIYENTGNFVLEITKEGGIFALISMIVVIVVSIISMVIYLKKSKDSHALKISILSLLVAFFLYSCFVWDIQPFTHSTEYVSAIRSFPFIIILFVLGLVYYPIFMKEEPLFESLRVIKEVKKEKKEVKYVDEDYVFTSAEGDEHNEK